MNRDVSNKIAAGMDRWQNTFEDMIHLRSSNNQVFKDNYWVSRSFCHCVGILQTIRCFFSSLFNVFLSEQILSV